MTLKRDTDAEKCEHGLYDECIGTLISTIYVLNLYVYKIR